MWVRMAGYSVYQGLVNSFETVGSSLMESGIWPCFYYLDSQYCIVNN